MLVLSLLLGVSLAVKSSPVLCSALGVNYPILQNPTVVNGTVQHNQLVYYLIQTDSPVAVYLSSASSDADLYASTAKHSYTPGPIKSEYSSVAGTSETDYVVLMPSKLQQSECFVISVYGFDSETEYSLKIRDIDLMRPVSKVLGLAESKRVFGYIANDTDFSYYVTIPKGQKTIVQFYSKSLEAPTSKLFINSEEVIAKPVCAEGLCFLEKELLVDEATAFQFRVHGDYASVESLPGWSKSKMTDAEYALYIEFYSKETTRESSGSVAQLMALFIVALTGVLTLIFTIVWYFWARKVGALDKSMEQKTVTKPAELVSAA